MSRIGSSVENFFPILGFHVPLRPGVWTLLGDVRDFKPDAARADIFLGRVENGRLEEALRILTRVDLKEIPDQYGPLKELENELYAFDEVNEVNGRQAKWTITNRITWGFDNFRDKTHLMHPVERLSAAEMSKRNISFPPEYLIAQFALREPGKLLQTSYHLNPAEAGVSPTARLLKSWRNSDFAPGNIRRHPDKFAFYEACRDWATLWWPGQKDCFATFHTDGL